MSAWQYSVPDGAQSDFQTAAAGAVAAVASLDTRQAEVAAAINAAIGSVLGTGHLGDGSVRVNVIAKESSINGEISTSLNFAVMVTASTPESTL